jgi:PAS domain S-box-containing protein
LIPRFLPPGVPCETILQSVADGIFTIDLDSNITFFNESAARITGVPAREALGRKCWEVFRSNRCQGACILRESLNQGREIVNKSILIMRRDGSRAAVSISASRLLDEKGRVKGAVETFRDLTESQILRRKLKQRHTLGDIVGQSQVMTRVLDILHPLATSEASVLLLGESGTGKELFARAIHDLSRRKDKPFVAVNCVAMPETLLESEMFGYMAGAFTGAAKNKPGRFQLAHGGTIFLDEVAEMPGSLQAKLLRVLQERIVEPLGCTQAQKVDVRVIAATNRDLDEEVTAGRFRQDLFYRLNVAQLRLPPLRDRPEDIPLLAEHFITRFNTQKGKDIQGVSEDVLALFLRHPFSGNVRELQNILEYAFILCPTGFIQIEHLPDSLQSRAGYVPEHLPGATMLEIKRQAALRALERHAGCKVAASRELGISRDTLRRILARDLAAGPEETAAEVSPNPY